MDWTGLDYELSPVHTELWYPPFQHFYINPLGLVPGNHTHYNNITMLKQDIYSIWFLILLYLLQGVIIGITISIPLILQSKGATWSQQAIFSFAYWPFSLKLLWAPIIDYGRRKSWLLPIQLLIGTTLIILSFYISQLLIDRQHILLTVIFLYLYFLTASQDICVDGWSLKMLTKENVGWSSTCQIVGQTIGLFIGNVVF
ncbi:unnamed protein product, partial [Didymodactylos carnosus]